MSRPDHIDAVPERCNHWNTTTGSIPLRPIRCAGPMGHDGPHYLGDTSWDEALGRRNDDPEDVHHTLEVVKAVEALLDDCDQVVDTLERPNQVPVWGVRRALMPFGGRPHRWKVPAERCAECNHLAWNHDDECVECDCVLSRREAEWGRDEALDDEITRAAWEDAVTNDEPWVRGVTP